MLGLRLDEAAGTTYTVFTLATVRQFRQFRYEIQLEHQIDPAARKITLTILGVRAPAVMMPSSGSAATEVAFADLAGSYSVEIIGARRSGSFGIEVNSRSIRLSDPPDEQFVSVTVRPEVETIRA